MCRWGGDEFLVLFNGSGQAAAEIRILEVIHEIKEATAVTMSNGIAEVNMADRNDESFT